MSSPQEAARTIIHVDLDAFFCAIEEQRDPSLRGRPFAVGGRPDGRGVVASCSYAARRFGVHSAMPTARAIGLCPSLIVVSGRHSHYREASQKVMALLGSYTPLLEQISIDEAFLDVSQLLEEGAGSAAALAEAVQNRVRDELGLSCSVGVGCNKLVAKIATDFGKLSVRNGRSPRAVCVVAPGDEAAFLAPLAVGDLWGVGPSLQAQFEAVRIRTIGDLAAREPRELLHRFGRAGYVLGQRARGIDKRSIVTHRERKSISTETTFSHDVDDWDVLSHTLSGQVAEVAERLNVHGMKCRAVRLKLRWSDFTTPTRQFTLPQPSARGALIGEVATRLLRQLWAPHQGVRLLGLGVGGLTPVQQLQLFSDDELTRSAINTPS